jgi:cytoplasmic iron level regulating protein YaaA (DUF328/UPF0246 family)
MLYRRFTMLILLPPSEGKSAPLSGSANQQLSFPELDATRTRVQKALIKMCKGDPQMAAKNLGLGVTQLEEVTANAHLARATCGPAIDVYTGVLYEALDAGSLNAKARNKLNTSVAISSALFGLVRPLDLIPTYRLSGNSILADSPRLPQVWRIEVSAVIADSTGPIIDLRSQTYVALGPIPAQCDERALVIRVLFEKNGKRSVVSHFNKATKGELVRALILSGPIPKSTDQFLKRLSEIGYEWELDESKAGPGRLDVITR